MVFKTMHACKMLFIHGKKVKSNKDSTKFAQAFTLEYVTITLCKKHILKVKNYFPWDGGNSSILN